MQHAGRERGEGGRVGGGFIGNDATRWWPSRSNRPLEERAYRNHVAARRDIHIHDLAATVDSAIDVVPAPANASVRFVDPPIGPHRLAVSASQVAEQGQEALHPAIDRALVDQ